MKHNNHNQLQTDVKCLIAHPSSPRARRAVLAVLARSRSPASVLASRSQVDAELPRKDGEESIVHGVGC